MKRILALLFAFAVFSVPAFAQQGQPVIRTFNLTSASPIGPVGTPWVSLGGLGINNHQLVWSTKGTVSSCSVKLQQSVDGVSWSDLIAGATCTSNVSGTLTAGIANYVRVNATTLTGSGTLVVTYTGFPPGLPATASISGTVDVAIVSGAAGGTEYTQDAALTVATTVGGMDVCRGSAAAPTAVSADNDATIGWCSLAGARMVQLTNAGVLTLSGSGTATAALRVELANNGTGRMATVDTVTAVTTVSTVSAVTAVGTITPGTAATSLGKAIDSVGGATDTGVAVLVIRDDALTTLTPVDGDYVALRTNSTGGLWVQSTIIDAAEGAAVATNPVPSGCVYRTTFTVGDAGDVMYPACDLNGRLVQAVAPGPLASGAVTSAMTGTTSTSVIGATASNYIYVTQCTASNASTTVSTDILLQDGSGGTTLYVIPAPAAAVATTGGGGGAFSFPYPLKVPTAGNALFAANVTTGSSTKLSCSGFKSTASF